MSDKAGFIIVGIFMISALGFSYFVNVNDFLNSLADQQFGGGFGTLCSSENDCRDFCITNMGRCRDYCRANASNPVCVKLRITK